MSRWLCVSLALLSGCTTQLDVTVESQVSGATLSRVEIEVRPSELDGPLEVALPPGEFPLTFALRPQDADDATVTIEARGYVAGEATPYTMHTVEARFEPGEVREVTLTLRDSCGTSADCAGAARCVEGVCVPLDDDAGPPDGGPRDAGPAGPPERCNGTDQDGDGRIDEGVCAPHTIAGGADHTCGIDAAGMQCWGLNRDGQLGDTTRRSSGEPSRVAGGLRWLDVSAGTSFTCGVDQGGEVLCWGSNGDLQIGDGLGATQPTIRLGLSDARRVVAGASFACALTNDDDVFCWGRASEGQTGHGSTAPNPVPGLSAVVDLSSGVAHTCALQRDATVRCWGEPSLGRLGQEDPATQPVTPPFTGVRDVAAGAAHTCVLLDQTPNIACFGSPGPHLGDAARTAHVERAIGLAVGNRFSCALTADGEVFCWGDQSLGQLGVSRPDPSPTPVRVPLDAARFARELVAGRDHACAGLDDGTTWCWGSDASGQLGVMADIIANAPVEVPIASDYQADALALGDRSTCALVRAPPSDPARVFCWGEGRIGRLGDGEEGSRSRPEVTMAIPEPVEIEAGPHGFLARTRTGELYAWGLAGGGRLGDGRGSAHLAEPGPVATNVLVNGLGLGQRHGCLLDTGRIARCFGRNDLSQLGASGMHGTPMPVDTVTRFSILATGLAHNLAVHATNGNVYCWGDNSRGQCGSDPSTDPTVSVPTLVPGVAGGRISAGDAHNCFTVATGQVRCFGANDRGQLGNGTTAASLTPVVADDTLLGLPQAIATGANHTCVVGGAGFGMYEVYCWGANEHGQVGAGFGDAILPRRVTEAPGDWIGVEAGVDHTCAIDPVGKVHCWGFDGDGALGLSRPLVGAPHPVGVAR